MKKEIDIVLFGATGFTGTLVAQYLANEKNTDLKIALAGRNLEKLKHVLKRVGNPDWELLQADVKDQGALDALAARTKVVCTTVGPYAKYGHGVAAACVKENAHYCDLTGETQFIRAVIDAHHEDAKANGTRIVNCCGFDSIPSDLGTFFLQQHAQEKFGSPCDEVNLYVTKIRGGFSGGTVASISNIVQEAGKDKALRKLLLDPYALNPKEDKPALKQWDQRAAVYAPEIDQWTAPFLMAPINTRIVRRTNALLEHRWGRDFVYHESMATGDGLKGRARAMGIAGGSGAMVAGLAISPIRAILEKTVLPASGEGPTDEEIERGHFTMTLVGTHKDGEIRAKVKGFKDPGYGATAIMLAESAKCLATDDLKTDGGVLTPATAMGDALVSRLVDAGMVFEVL